MPRFHIPSLDGFRAVAIMIVFLSHAGLEHVIPGGLGVTIFFFLSGYLITTLLRREMEGTGTISFRQFYIRRAWRIWPAFYLVLATTVFLTRFGSLPGEVEAMPLLSRVLHFGNYYSIFYGEAGVPVGSAVYWSLAVEEHYYLVFPFVYYWLLRLSEKFNMGAFGTCTILMGLCAAALVWRCILAQGLQPGDLRIMHGSDTRMDSILYGCLLAIAGNPVLDEWRLSDRLLKVLLVPAGVAALFFTLLYRDPFFRETWRYTLQGIALIPIFTAAIRYPDWLPFKALNTRVFRSLGLISYPLYLVHATVLEALKLSGLRPSAQVVLAFAGSCALAAAIHIVIERPLARFRNRPSILPT